MSGISEAPLSLVHSEKAESGIAKNHTDKPYLWEAISAKERRVFVL